MSRYTDEQMAFVDYFGEESIILSSVAGSGKTHSAVGKLNKMIERGVDPKRIIFFSFTNDAVNELKQRVKHDVRITTIHSYTSSQLGKMGKFKPITNFYEFATWYRENFKPKPYAPKQIKEEWQKQIDSFYEDGQYISSSFAAFKLQWADGVKVPKPKLYDEYIQFLKETNARDFTDLLIETEKLCRMPEHKRFFEGTYDYVFIDEYQDTSTLQLKILLTINARQYYLIGDKNQSIYGFSGANCDAIEALLRENRKVREMTLTKNFRSAKSIVEHANKFSNLKAVPFHEQDGLVQIPLIGEDTMFDMIEDSEPLTILARTNAVIKEIEMLCLRRKIKMRYFNFITPQDIEYVEAGKVNPSIKKKLEKVVPYHQGGLPKLLEFIREHQNSNTYITSIHKSKGREYPRVIVVNSFDPTQLEDMPHLLEDHSFLSEEGEVDVEALNLHYVACSRPKEEIYFLYYDL